MKLWWNFPTMALHLPSAVSRIAHTVTVCILFECASPAQKWIAATLRNNVLFAKNGRLQIKKIDQPPYFYNLPLYM
jgi:hypothetical protein